MFLRYLLPNISETPRMGKEQKDKKMLKNKKLKKQIYEMSIVCDKEITTRVLQMFKYENINFKKIKTDGIFGTEITIEMKK